MKKAALALITCAAVAVAPRAFAQEQGDPLDIDIDDDAEGGSCGCSVPGTSAEGAATQAPSSALAATTTLTSVSVPMPMTPVHREPETIIARERILPSRPLLYTGGGMLVGAYLTSAALTATGVFQNPDKTLYIPVVGPWLHLKDVPEGIRDKVLIAGSGVVQGAGLALTVASFFIPQKISAAVITAGDVKMTVTPTAFGAGSAGAMAVGLF